MSIFSDVKELVELGEVEVSCLGSLEGLLEQTNAKLDIAISVLATMAYYILDGKPVIPPTDPPVVPVDPPVVPPMPVEPDPPCVIVDMKDDCALFVVDYLNAKGLPVMENANVYKSVVGDRWQVLADAILGDGGISWWTIWEGPWGCPAGEEAKYRGCYIKKDKTRIV